MIFLRLRLVRLLWLLKLLPIWPAFFLPLPALRLPALRLVRLLRKLRVKPEVEPVRRLPLALLAVSFPACFRLLLLALAGLSKGQLVRCLRFPMTASGR